MTDDTDFGLPLQPVYDELVSLLREAEQRHLDDIAVAILDALGALRRVVSE